MDMGDVLDKHPKTIGFLVSCISIIWKTWKACYIILDVLVQREDSGYNIKPISSPEWTQAVQKMKNEKI